MKDWPEIRESLDLDEDAVAQHRARLDQMAAIYEVVVSQEGGQWLVEVPALPGTRTWADTRGELDAAVREAIALTLDLPAGAEPDLQLVYTEG